MALEKIKEVQPPKKGNKKIGYSGYVIGLLLTFTLAIIAGQIARLPFFSIMGIMIISILLGALWSNLRFLQTPVNANLGITFSSRTLLRLGIILLGFRLNLTEIVNAGFSIILIDVLVITFTMLFILLLGKVFHVHNNLTMLIAAGTAICGAAAIVALAPTIKSKKEQTAIAVSCIAILGTIGSLLLIFLFPLLPIGETEYGILVGATLHELAHVVAASAPGGDLASDSAILVKLGRVTLLIPVIFVISLFLSAKNSQQKQSPKNLPIPWFILGFLLISIINTYFFIPEDVINLLLVLSTYLLAMGMVGLGVTIKWEDFKKVGIKPVVVSVLGFTALLTISPLFIIIHRLLS